MYPFFCEKNEVKNDPICIIICVLQKRNYLRFLSEMKAPATLDNEAAAKVTTSAFKPDFGNFAFDFFFGEFASFFLSAFLSSFLSAFLS